MGLEDVVGTLVGLVKEVWFICDSFDFWNRLGGKVKNVNCSIDFNGLKD